MKFILVLLNILIIVCLTECLKVAQPCKPSDCKLPNCKCSTSESGNNIPVSKIPQIVLLSFDDATTIQTYKYFEQSLFNRKNPDGCPIGVTHFLTHEYTDYARVHDLWLRGHEIALHSVTHLANITYWRDMNISTFKSEFDDMRQMATYFAQIPKSDIRGVRLPFLQTSGDVSFQGIKELGLSYDSSMPSLRYLDKPLWPYTLDYASHQECMIYPCPTASFPGIWEVPMTVWIDEQNVSCSMVDACVNIPTHADQIYKWIIKQFERHYKGTRAPFPVFMHAAWFLRTEENFKAYKMFIDYLQKLKDVYIININKAIEWIKKPKSLDNKKPFGECEVRVPSATCNPHNCELKTVTGEIKWMASCVEVCPDKYPWLYNPFGK